MIKSVILYFGSFNPIHKGHIAVADNALDTICADELWFIVSPQNPFKESNDLVSIHHRLAMTETAVQDARNRDKIKVSDIEALLPIPSKTINTLNHLKSTYPYTFSLLIGSDNADDFDKWFNYREIIDQYEVFVYPRDGYTLKNTKLAGCFKFIEDVEKFPESATLIRDSNDCHSWLNPKVINYIKEHNLYGM